MKNLKKNNTGYTLVETIFYITLFAMLSVAVINALITMTKAFKQTSIHADLMQGGNVMERISREIRQATAINTISTSDLKLNAPAGKTVEFLLSGSDIQLLENNVITGNLNTGDVSITGLTFTQIDTTKGKAVKVVVTLKSDRDSQNRTESFYDTIVLRGGY